MGEGKITIVKNGCMEGPNVFALFPVLEGIIDLDEWSETPSTPTCAERLIHVLPELKDHKCSRGHTGGFIERLNEGTYPEHIIEHVALALQNKVGCDVAYGKSKRYDDTLYQIALEYDYKPVASSALRGAVELVNSLLSGEKSELELQDIVDKTVEEEKELIKKSKLGPSTSALLEAARRRGIPFDRQHDEFNLYSLGWGKNRKMIWGPVTSETNLMGSDIAQDKELTKQILYRSCFPVPDGEIVDSLERAVEVSESLGYPVVMKPLKGHHGEGVVGDLRNKEEVERAYDITRSYSSEILVERYLHGEDFRFLVVDGKITAVAKRIPPYVVGDGGSTIRQLVDIINQDPMRSEGHTSLLTKIELGKEELLYLDNIGMDPETIPGKGEKVYLRSGGNLSTGGTSIDVTDIVDEHYIQEIERLGKMIGMDVVGVDVIAEDITEYDEKANWGIIELNASPGLRMHLYPTEGKSRDVAEEIVDSLFPEGDGRIPVVSITGTNGKTTTSRMIEWMARRDGFSTGLTVTGGIYINGRKICEGDTTGPWSAEVVLNSRDVDFAVLETARGGIVKRGLGFDSCNVSVVTNIREDHIGLDGIYDLEDLYRVKSLVVDVTDKNGYVVLNGEDDYCEKLMKRSSAEVVLFSTEINDLVEDHIRNGGVVFTEKDGSIVYYDGQIETQLIDIPELPFMKTYSKMMIENTLASIAAAFSSGIGFDTIRFSLMEFKFDEKMNPGRLNMYEFGPLRMVLDYAHNPDCFRALGEYVSNLEKNRSLIVFSMPGDRDDEFIKSCSKVVSEKFDIVICTENIDILRGRKEGEIAEILRKGLVENNCAGFTIDEMGEAIDFALDIAQKDDLVVLADLDITRDDLIDHMFRRQN